MRTSWTPASRSFWVNYGMSAEDIAYDSVISLSGEVLGGDELAGDVVVLGSLQDVGLAVIAEDESDLTIDLVLVDSIDDGLSIE